MPALLITRQAPKVPFITAQRYARFSRHFGVPIAARGGAPAVSRLMSVTPLDPPTPLIRNPQDAKSRNKERTARGHQLRYFLVEMNALTESANGEEKQ